MQHAAVTKSDGSVSRTRIVDTPPAPDLAHEVHPAHARVAAAGAAALADLAAWIATDEAARRAVERRRLRGTVLTA